jgi:hypothetical protein
VLPRFAKLKQGLAPLRDMSTVGEQRWYDEAVNSKDTVAEDFVIENELSE